MANSTASSLPTAGISLVEQLDINRRQSMKGMDIPWMLRTWAERTPDQHALIWEPFEGEAQTWTYAELRQQARRMAAGLYARGVRAGDFVLLHLDNCPEFIVSWYGCAELGAVAVSTNTRSVARDLEYFAAHIDAVCAITQPAYADLVRQSCVDIRFCAVTDNDTGTPATVRMDAATIPFAELAAGTADSLPALAVDPMRNLSVQFTSGTTSRPKAVLWTHANGLWAGKISASHLRLSRHDVTLIFMPLFHTNAQGYSMLSTHWSGGTVVLQPKFSASRFWDVSLRHSATWLSTIPFAFKALMDQPVPAHSYRLWGTAAHLPQLGQHFGVDVMGWWGMTETLTHGIVTDHDLPGPMGTIGRVAPEYEIQIRRRDGSLAEPGESGLLFIRGVRGVTLFSEYYRNPEANESAFDQHGWFDTGDVIRMDEHGWLYFSDRDKDMLKVGAENVAASEIESVIMQTGLVKEVAVVAQKHYMLDEVPVAFVIPAVDHTPEQLESEIITYCQINLADFKVVRSVKVVDELPRSTLEKVAKAELRSRLDPITEGR